MTAYSVTQTSRFHTTAKIDYFPKFQHGQECNGQSGPKLTISSYIFQVLHTRQDGLKNATVTAPNSKNDILKQSGSYVSSTLSDFSKHLDSYSDYRTLVEHVYKLFFLKASNHLLRVPF